MWALAWAASPSTARSSESERRVADVSPRNKVPVLTAHTRPRTPSPAPAASSGARMPATGQELQLGQ
eukprot:8996463-Alexandrium_andersonii.AAC.1